MALPRLCSLGLAALLAATTLPLAQAAAAQQWPEDGRGQGLFTAEWHEGRRQALMETFLEKATDRDGVIVLRGAGDQNDYREFRQDNNFWYFTGITTPNAAYVCVPKTGEEYLLLPLVNPSSERWLGDLISPEEGREYTTIRKVTKLSKDGVPGKSGNLEALLEKLAKKHDTFYVQRQPAENWMMSRDYLLGAKADVMRDRFDGRTNRGDQFGHKLEEAYEVEVQDITLFLDNLRLVKTPEEAQAMRRACEISGEAHVTAMRTARPGEYEWQVGARMTGKMLELGAMGPAYLAIVGSGGNACILHYPLANKQLKKKEVVMIDYGAEYRHYVADISRSWPVDETFSKRQREVYQAVYDAQEAAFAACKPGSTLGQVGAAAQRVISERGFGRMWHGTSHWLGMATHDVGASRIKFEPGMVFTVEPGVYLPDEGIGVRIEDVVLITEDGYELLSSSIPRKIEDIEALRAQAWDGAE
jgi:Xaa-Pro aminopeptidase